MSAVLVLPLAVEGYCRNRLHGAEMPWQETNCYVDVLIEVIHSLGAEVEPCLAFTLASDFELDQWTFFKPPLKDLDLLYGIDVQELTLWRDLPAQCEAQVAGGRLPLLEVDAFYLPDTDGTDYRRNHTKTTIAINEIDVEAGTLGYFHNAGYHGLAGDDYDGLFRLSAPIAEGTLPPYCEIVKRRGDGVPPVDVEAVIELIRYHAGRRPVRNPFNAYAEVFDLHLAWIREGGLATYHAYVFASLRQCGAAFDLAGRLLGWIDPRAPGDWAQPAAQFGEISATAKRLLMKLARVASGKAGGDYAPQLEQMGDAWKRGFDDLDRCLEVFG